MTGPLRLPVLLVALVAAAIVVPRLASQAPPERVATSPRGLGAGPPRGVRPAQRPLAIGAAGMLEHLRALERIARRHGNSRAAGTAGDTASVEYVSERMRAAGYHVRLERLRFPFFEARGAPRLEVAGEEIEGARTIAYSGVGSSTGPLWGVDVDRATDDGERDSGCQSSDFTGLPRGAVTLLERGGCTLGMKVGNARLAGAGAAIVFNDGRAGRSGQFSGTLGPTSAPISAVSVSHASGRRLVSLAGGPVALTVRATSEIRTTTNVIADSRHGGERVVIAGAHLDSVPEGPGINDNGSGVAALIEAAEALEARARERSPVRGLRFAFWGAEELGLLGSTHYVEGLSDRQRADIDGYLNLDMVGSGNGGRFFYSGDGARSRRIASVARSVLARAGSSGEAMGLDARSDHMPFARAAIPVAGLFSGADSDKSRRQQRVFGGRAGEPYHRCYHSACDTLASVDPRTLGQLGRAAAETLRVLVSRGVR